MIDPPRTLLVLKPSSFGDIVHTLPAVARLKAAWPRCRISWLVNSEWMPLLAGNPDVDELVEFPRRTFRGWGGGAPLVRWLRKEIVGRRPDLALDFQGLLRSALVGRVSGADRVLGLADAREGARWFYHTSVTSPPQPAHAVDRYLTLAEAALTTFRSGEVSSEKTARFRLPDGQPPASAKRLDDGYVLLHPYARGKSKSLSESDINDFVRSISTRQIVLVGQVGTAAKESIPGCLDLLNQTSIPELIWLLRRASCVVSVDSGPAHLAAALGTPLIAVHGWTDPRKVGPHRPDAWVWKNGALARVSGLPDMNPDFFEPRPLKLGPEDVEAIASLATSLSGSCA